MGCLGALFGFLSVNAIFFLVWMFSGGETIEGYFVLIGCIWIGGLGIVFLINRSEKKAHYKDLGIDDYSDGKGRAIFKLESMHWIQSGSVQSRQRQYVTSRKHGNDIGDFDWVVKFISAFGSDNNESPYVQKSIILGDSIYKCQGVNTKYNVSSIYRIPLNENEVRKIEDSMRSKPALNPKTLKEAMDIHVMANPVSGKDLDSFIDNILDSAKEFYDNNPQFFQSSSNRKSAASTSETVSHSDDLVGKAAGILNSQPWECIGIKDNGRTQYVCTKQNSPNHDDFKWVVKYLSGIGIPEQPKNPCSYVVSSVDGVEYKSIKVNKFFEGTVIYRFGDSGTASAGDVIKEGCDIYALEVEERLRNHPVVQYNMALIQEMEAELKVKVEEYREQEKRKDDEVFISLSTTGPIDYQEYEEQLEDMRAEISDLEGDIQDLREEIEDIRQDIEDEIEDEEWEM